MFSKPIVIASSIAAANAALMGQTSTAFATVTQAAGLYSDDIGCGACLSYTDTTFITASADSLWETIASAAKAALNATTATNIDGWICCKDKATKETTSTGTTLCAVGKPDSSNTNKGLIDAATEKSFYWPTVLAQCPHQKDTCVVAGLKADGKTALTFTDERYLELTELKSSVTLTMKILATADLGTAPSLKQRKGDVCSWVVAGQCHAPVLTVPKGSGAVTAATPEWSIQITEWSGEFTPSTSDAQQGATWTANAGASSKLYYPAKADLSKIVTDLQATTVEATAPNNIMGDVGFNLATGSSEYTYTKVPGGVLNDWIDWVSSVYKSYDAEVVKYEVERKAWKTYAEYTAPAPGLFGPTADPDAPKAMSSPRQPTQPVDVPTTIANLKDKTTYNGAGGYGWPSAMMLVPVAEKTVRPWGVLAGGGQLKTTSTAATDADSTYSMRKTTNVGLDAAKCDKSYLMITGMIDKAPGTALSVQLTVTAADFQKTLAERIPTRPGATTAPVAAPAGAAQLAASAVAAALTALYLF